MKRKVRLLAIAALVLLGPSSVGAVARAQTAGTNGTIVFEREQTVGGDRDLYRVGPAGGQPQLLWASADAPHWSPNGRMLAFETCLDPPTCDTAVALLDPVTGIVQGFSMPDPNVFTACAIWTPDATRLACEGQGQSDPARNGIYTIRATDGAGLKRITSNPGGDDSPLDYSPDGAQLVFARTDPTRAPRANQALFVATAAGLNAHRVTPWGFWDDQASWSPDGNTIVFGTRPGGGVDGGSLYRVRPDGTGLTRITLQTGLGTQPGNAFDAAWSPDGTRLVFSLRPAGSTRASIYTATPDGQNLRALTTSPTGDHHANWGDASTP